MWQWYQTLAQQEATCKTDLSKARRSLQDITDAKQQLTRRNAVQAALMKERDAGRIPGIHVGFFV